MKKLLVTVIGATAAIGAFAGYPLQFDSIAGGETSTNALNSAHGGDYWYANPEATNEYKIETAADVAPFGTCPPTLESLPSKALSIKTKFKNPLSANFVDGGATTNINAGLFFDSLVKFTVCDTVPDTDSYDNAKIVMWLQEDEDRHETNLWVRAGYLSADGTTISSVSTNYMTGFGISDTFADKWHRVTIKAIADITADNDNVEVPGFAIYIDANENEPTPSVTCGDAKWDDSFEFALTEDADFLRRSGAVFPSMVQSGANKKTLEAVAFDGTGSISDLVFTDQAPDFADDHVEPKVAFYVGETELPEIKTIEGAFEYISSYSGSSLLSLQLTKDVEINAPLTVPGKTLVLDFNGKVITYLGAGAAINNGGLLTITNSSDVVGGILCADNGIALADSGEGSLTITAGNFWGHVTLDEGEYSLIGGAFKYGDDDFEDYLSAIPSGKTLKQNQEAGMWEIVPATYTITFISGEGSATNKNENCTYEQVINVPTPAVVVGKTFSAWSPAIDGATVTATADATYTAQYTLNSYNVTFVDANGTGATLVGVTYGTVLSTIAPAIGSLAGYTAAWDTDLAGTVTGNTTVTAVYTGKTFTINTYVIDTVGVNATTNFTYAGESVDPAAPNFDAEDKTWDGKWYTGSDKAAEFAFDPDGETTQSAWVELQDKGGELPNIPAGGEAECGTAEAAADAADAINKDAASKAAHIAIPAGVSDTTTYLTYVEAKAEGTKVKVDFSDDGAAVAQTSANNDVVSEAVSAAVAAAAAAGSEGSGTASVSTVAGFYYSIVSGTSPTAVTTEGTRVLGTGGSVNLTVPNKGPAGFYKVKVSARAAD